MRKNIKKLTTAIIITSMALSLAACSKVEPFSEAPGKATKAEKTTEAVTEKETKTEKETQTEKKTEKKTQKATAKPTEAPTKAVTTTLPVMKSVKETNNAGSTTTSFNTDGLLTTVKLDDGTQFEYKHTMNDKGVPSKVDYYVSADKTVALEFEYTYDSNNNVTAVKFIFPQSIKDDASKNDEKANETIAMIADITGHYKYYTKFANATITNNVNEDKRIIKNGAQIYVLSHTSVTFTQERTYSESGQILKIVASNGTATQTADYTYNANGTLLKTVVNGNQTDFTYTETTEGSAKVYTATIPNSTVKYYIADGYVQKFIENSADGTISETVYNKYGQILTQSISATGDITTSSEATYY